MQHLKDLIPEINNFRSAAGYYIKKGTYPRYPEGRPCDAFLLVIEGALKYNFGDYSFTIKKGDLAYIAKGSSFTLSVTHERCGLLQMDFMLSLPEDKKMKSEVVTPVGIKNIEYLFRSCATSWQTMHHNRKIECLAKLYSVYAEFLSAGKSAYIPSHKKERMEKAAEYIDEHISEDTLDTAHLAKVFGMSDSHFRHSFKEVHNMAVSEYILKTRIRVAKRMLQFSSDSMTQIANEVGYSSIYYFSSAFKKEVGYSPSEYRKKKQIKI